MGKGSATVCTYGDEYKNLEYEFAIGTSAGATDVVGWTGFDVEPDGSVTLDGLELPFNQEYFVSLCVLSEAGGEKVGVSLL